jgi:hypothetical protein
MTTSIYVWAVIPDISNRTSSRLANHESKREGIKSNEKELVSDYTKLILAEYNFISQTRIQQFISSQQAS